MKKAKEEIRLAILLELKEAELAESRKVNCRSNVDVLVTKEAHRLNIPEGWHYDFNTGEFYSPQEMEERQRQAAPQQGPQPFPTGGLQMSLDKEES